MPPFFNHRVVHLTISVIVVHSFLRKGKPGGLAAALGEIMMTGYVKLQNDPDTEWRKVTYRQINRGIQIEEPNEAINYISRATADFCQGSVGLYTVLCHLSSCVPIPSRRNLPISKKVS